MKKPFKKLLSLFIIFTLILSCIYVGPSIAFSADTTKEIENAVLPIWADVGGKITQEDVDKYSSGESKTTMAGAVTIHKRSSGSTYTYYFFLPSTANCESLTFWYTGNRALTINGKNVEKGVPTDALADINEYGSSKKIDFVLGNSKYTVTCLKSGLVGTVFVDTKSGSMATIDDSSNHTAYESGTVMIIDSNGNIEYDGALDKIQGRGNATWGKSKKPYNIKLAESTSLLGMPKAKKWCLLANALDPTLVRNQMGYDYAKYIGIKYQPICKPVDLYCNQIYVGSYQLSEKVEIKSNRINVNDAYENLEISNGAIDAETGIMTPADFDLTPPAVKTYNSTGGTASSSKTNATVGNRRYSTSLNNPTDITGGYLYEIEMSERWTSENAGFCAYNRQCWVMKSTDYATKEMVDYSYDLLYALGSAVYNKGVVPSASTKTTSGAMTSYGRGETITNPAPAEKYQGKRWSDLLDAESAVKYFWIEEYFKNLDSSTSSTYFYKDSDAVDSKVYSGPIWDLDHSMETVVTDAGLSTAISLMGGRYGYDWSKSTGWYARNVRIYKWDGSSSGETARSDAQSPLSFYGALYYNNTDFQNMFNKLWYTTMTPANKVLMGEDVDESGTLKSIDEYFDAIQYTANMNNVRQGFESSDKEYFNLNTLKSGVKKWFNERITWIDKEIPRVDISKVKAESIPNQAVNGTAIEPKLELSYNDIKLVEGADYDVAYSNNTGATDSAIATVTGKGYFTGTIRLGFEIEAGAIEGVSIVENTYAGDTLTASVKTTSGDEINHFVSYQWNANGEAIEGATDNTYCVANDDIGKNISVTVSGDNENIIGTVTSNSAYVLEIEKPAGLVKTIANWNYDFTDNADALATADEAGALYYYTATGGVNALSSELRASVDGVNNNKIKWSGTADLYENDKSTVNPDEVPVMGTSKTDNLAWGNAPYFEAKISTVGYKSIKFSARLGGSKKAPRSWMLQYSIDGIDFVDIENSEYTIKSNKIMEQAFDNVELPEECSNREIVYIRAIACEDMAINGVNTIVGQVSGDSAINNIEIKGESMAAITELLSPSVTTNSICDGNSVFSTDSVIIEDNNGGAELYYSIDDGDAIKYADGFNPFNSSNAKIGDTVTIKAWAEAGIVRSNEAAVEIAFAGVNLNTFSFSDYSKNVSNGIVYSTAGAYGQSAKMTAYTDGKSQYAPLWNADNGAYSISPDDGALWTEQTGFYFEAPTAGYSGIRFSAKLYTTGSGPNSVTLQYSMDRENWTDAVSKVVLSANGELEQAFENVQLSEECSNKSNIFIRVISKEDLTNLGARLHNNESKGNLYINDVVIAGQDNGEYKMPYTNKTTNRFGSSPIKYNCADNMQYAVINPNGEVILAGTYPNEVVDDAGNVIREEGIDIVNSADFNRFDAGAYRVSVWSGDDDDRSVVNTKEYYYKGSTVVKFSYTSTKRPIASYVDETGTVLKNTGGQNAGELSMYPNGVDAALVGYSDTYGVKIGWSAENPFVATKKLDKPSGNGYWLIKASTKGYKSLSLNIEQLSSNKGPRDFGIAYSLDGESFIYLKNSNARAISNDASISPVETYNNLALPDALNDKDEVYIKVFINGGETVDGSELEAVLKGNTGINNIELSGISIAREVDYTINAVAYESKDYSVAGNVNVPAYIAVDNNSYYAENGTVVVKLIEGNKYTIAVSPNEVGTFTHRLTFVAQENGVKNIPIVAVDLVADGVINAKDYAVIRKEKNEYLSSIFSSFVNEKDK